MIEILNHIHKYVPVEKTVSDEGVVTSSVILQVFLGGDQLTEERARNARSGRAHDETKLERLEGVITKIEDWHTSQHLYQAMIMSQFQQLQGFF